MKKLVMTFVLAVGIGFAAMAQPEFRHISYAEGLEAAKAENKLLFIDFYTEWCGPCKQMMRDVFPQKEVGDFMNAHFVCLKIDAEKGEGMKLAERYNIQAYPTFLLINADDKEVGRREGGGSPSDFILAMERLLDPEQTPERLVARYESGERTPGLIKAYAAYLKESASNRRDVMEAWNAINAVVQDYFKGLSDTERLEPANLFVYTDYTHSIEDESAKFIAVHHNEFPAETKERVMECLREVYNMTITDYLIGKILYDVETFTALKQEIEDYELNNNKEFEPAFRLIEKYAEGDLEVYLSLCEKEYNKLPVSCRATFIDAFPNLINTNDRAILEHANRFVRSQLPDMEVNEIYFAAMAIKKLEEKINMK